MESITSHLRIFGPFPNSPPRTDNLTSTSLTRWLCFCIALPNFCSTWTFTAGDNYCKKRREKRWLFLQFAQTKKNNKRWSILITSKFFPWRINLTEERGPSHAIRMFKDLGGGRTLQRSMSRDLNLGLRKLLQLLLQVEDDVYQAWGLVVQRLV